jgi:uncharacterized SAM-binding protein YcdF (DUF218 family)
MPRPVRRAIRTCLLALGILAAALALLGAIAYSLREPILTWIGERLIHVDALAESDAIAVLAGGSMDRELEAVDLYLAKRAPRVVLTVPPESPSYDVLRRRGVRAERPIDTRVRYLRELGVAASAIVVLPETVESTADEAAVVSHWAEEQKIRDLIVVTSAYHTARARFIFRHALRGSGITLRVRPSSLDGFRPDTWFRRRTFLRLGVEEVQKTVYYRLRYW